MNQRCMEAEAEAKENLKVIGSWRAVKPDQVFAIAF